MKYEPLVMHLKSECEGVPIGSSADGYFYAVTAGEVYTTIRQLRAMESGLKAAISGLESALYSFGESEGGEVK